MRGTKLDILCLNEKIQKTRDMKESKKDFSNAILHIWGYFKKDASIIEKQTLFDILNEYMDEKNSQKHVIEYINTLLKKYPNEYLQKSTLLTGEQYETMAEKLIHLLPKNQLLGQHRECCALRGNGWKKRI